ncbi:hypothetical protein [Knoellia subterranea]|uniref:Smu12A n=1 Tax=Knoellia subterranea KCTC 19937 TaxID=1385521 RepID=A0A0A0JL40_9MICO|nr:hypothetical protein [Knoellia subterranea]KGN36356.1 hypothetical protein N803_06000 [Knoellia subterranea KCTC 19937]
MRSHHTHFTPEDTPRPTERGSRRGMPGRGPGGPRGGRGMGGPGGGRGRGMGRGMGRPGGWQQADVPSADDAQDWFTGRLPSDWFTDVDINVDRDEITVIGTLAAEDLKPAEAEGRISRWRADTKEARIAIAQEAEARYERKVSWGVRLGETEALFTHLAAPVMTRLRQPERQVLDTLVDAGVARSRSDALAWSVRLVGQHADEWLGQLREAMSEVDKLRSQGPGL